MNAESKLFVVIDVKTASPDAPTIFQIGAQRFMGGNRVSSWQILINPEGKFSPENTLKYNIAAADVRDEPTFPQAFESLMDFCGDLPMASYGGLTKLLLEQACARYGLPALDRPWIDILVLARRIWPRLGRYDLYSVCESFDLPYDGFRDARADALAGLRVLLHALQERNINFDQALDRIRAS